MIVIDTNVMSALMAPAIDDPVATWLHTIDQTDIYYTTVTHAEIRYGLARLPDGRRKRNLVDRANRLFADAQERVLPFDVPAADRYGTLVAGRAAGGAPISVPDAQIAAIAAARGATVATRNIADFIGCGVPVVNPWDPPAGESRH